MPLGLHGVDNSYGEVYNLLLCWLEIPFQIVWIPERSVLMQKMEVCCSGMSHALVLSVAVLGMAGTHVQGM